ncbi:hypothetical protein ES703_38155 [subsurface metagenome]
MCCVLIGGEHGKEDLSTEKKKEKADPWLPKEDEDQVGKEGLEEEKKEEKKTLNGLRDF